MRRTGEQIGAKGEGLLDALERHRDHHFRRTRSRRVTGEKSALEFINAAGFCSAFTAGLGVPCLREAISGEREPVQPEHIQHDYAIGMTWRLKDTLPARRLVYYGKVIGGRPSFIALELLGVFLKLRLKPGGYLSLYRRGGLSHCAKLVMDVLTKRGVTETKALKLSSGYARPRDRAVFDRSMKELQEKFLALKVEERYEPFTYVWDTLEHRWPDAVREARAIRRRDAAYVVVRRYFEIAAYGNERAVARLLGIEPALYDFATNKLERDGVLRRHVRIDGITGTYDVLAQYASALTTAA
ncbi:MAG: AlkZ-related protein [Candidatus Binataceae bacterium]